MRDFTPSEEQVLIRLLAVSSGPPVRLERFLEEVFFSEQHGRALILQPAGRFGCFYLKPPVHDDEQARGEEVGRLIELMMLIIYLREQGFVVVSGGTESRRQMRFIGALFQNPKPSTAHIVLNERGDYTFDPAAICDRADTVIYKGVRLEADLYDLVASAASGLLYVPPALKTLIPPPPPAPPPSQSRLRAVGRWAVSATAIGAAAWLVYLSTAQWGGSASAAMGRASSEPGRAVTAADRGKDGGDPVSLQPAVVPASGVAVPADSAAPPADDDRTERYGVDLSRWNAGELGPALDTGRLDFVFVRATYGRGTDTDFDRNWSLLQQRGIIRGAYHFYLVHDDPIEQAEHYLSVIGGSEPLEMPPAVDFEELSFPPRATTPDVPTVQGALLSALAHIESRTQRVPILYTNVSVGNRYLADPRFARYPLWIADWTPRDEPTLPEAWKGVGYRFWQRTSQYRLTGSATDPVDFDIFRGPRSDLYR